MKRIFHTPHFHPSLDVWLLVFRMCIAAFMLTHGIPKLMKLLAGEIKFADPLGIGVLPSLVLVVFAEVVCSVLLLLGLGTRISAAFLIINMAVAAFLAKSGSNFQDKELALMYLLIYITFFVSGAGKYSVDSLISNRKAL